MVEQTCGESFADHVIKCFLAYSLWERKNYKATKLVAQE